MAHATHMQDGPISQPGVLRALAAAGTVFRLFADMFLQIRPDVNQLSRPFTPVSFCLCALFAMRC